MTDYSELTEYFQEMKDHIASIDPDFASDAIIELALFCVYIIKIDDQITQEEINIIREVVQIPAKRREIRKIIKKTDWEFFENGFPPILQFGIVADIEAEIELSDPKSRTTKYYKNMRLLATALASVGGMTQEKTDIINSYIDSLGTRALDFFFKEFQGLENESSEKSKVIKQKPTKKTKRSKTKKFKKGNSKTIKISPNIQEFFRLTLEMFSYNQEAKDEMIADIIDFCLFIVYSERAITDREAQFLETITMTPTTKEELEELKLSMDFVNFISNAPNFFNFTIPVDVSGKFSTDDDDDEDSMTLTFINHLSELGAEFAEVEGTSRLQEERITQYYELMIDLADAHLNDELD